MESSRMWPEPWAPAKSTPASPPSHSTSHNGRFSAEISRYWIPGLDFCARTMSRQWSMLQERHALQAKAGKAPLFISIRKGEKCHPSFLNQTKEGLFSSAGLFPL